MSDPAAVTDEEAAINVDAIRVDARELLARCSGYRFDLEEQDGGWRVHYAIDADVIVTYLSASENLRHGMLFSASEQQAEVVVRMITDFMMRNLVSGTRREPGLGQLLIISPHDEEIQRYLIRLQSRIYARSRPKVKHAQRLLKMVQSTVSNEALANALIADPRLLRLLTGPEGALSSIKRFAEITAGRVINMLRYQEQRADDEPYTFPVPPQSHHDKDYDPFMRSYEDWKSALAKHQNSKTDWALHNDAQVLATLEWVNRQIEPERRRLVLVTGSHNIFSTVASRDVAHVPVHERFEAKYLRHPQAFLGDNDFFSVHDDSVPGKEFRVLEWLDVFIPKFIGEHSWEKLSVITDRFATQRRDKAKAPDNTTGDVKAFVKQWSEQINTVALKRKMDFAARNPKSQIGELVAEVRQAVRLEWTAEEFSLYLEERAHKKLITLYTATAMLGMLKLRDEENRVRGVPALRFEEKFSNAQRICENMQEIMFKHSPTLDLHALYETLHEIDPHHYHKMVLHGFAYAIRGHWSATRTFCQMALEIADSAARDELLADKVTGREAAYLLCVAQRRLADDEHGIEAARGYLQQAAGTRETNTFRDLRFDSEAVACDVSSLSLRRFGNDGKQAEGEALPLLQEKLTEAQRILSKLPTEELGSIKNWVTRQVFISMMTLALVAEIDAPGSTRTLRDSLTEISELFRREKLSPDKGGKHRDQLSDVLFWSAVIVLGVPSERPVETAVSHMGAVIPEKHGKDQPKVEAILDLCRRRTR